MARILMIAGYARSLINFRGDLIKKMVTEGNEVIAMAPETDYEEFLRPLGAQYVSMPLCRTGTNPFKDLYALFFLVKIMKSLKPDIVFAYTIKPVIYGSLAARFAGIAKVYSMVTGLGYAFTRTTIKQQMLEKFVSFLYKQAFKGNEKIYFQNPDDLALFHNAGILPDTKKTVLINGSGVDLEKFAYVLPRKQPMSFLLIARLLRDKGICEFAEAAHLLKQRYPAVSFKIVGPYDSNPNSIGPKDIMKWESDEGIEYLGETDDVRPYLTDASVYVLPSYREGTPRSVLEAMSMGRPVITTDAPGCRETVIDGKNGFLVPIMDSQALADAMERFIVNPDLISIMGAKSREIAVDKYDVHKVNESIMQAMGLVNPYETNR